MGFTCEQIHYGLSVIHMNAPLRPGLAHELCRFGFVILLHILYCTTVRLHTARLRSFIKMSFSVCNWFVSVCLGRKIFPWLPFISYVLMQ